MLKILVGFGFLLGLCWVQIGCPPVQPSAKAHEPINDASHTNETGENDPLLTLEYNKYLKEVVNLLESDPEFKRMIENASADDIKSGKISNHLQFVNHNVRTKLDELKRQEIDRLRQLISRKAKLHNMESHDIEKLLPRHLDHGNVDTFEEKDLEKLIRQASFDLEEYDKLRKAEFKQHEIEKEFDRRKKLQELDEEHRRKAEEEHQKNMERRKHHEKINHPGSKDQLEEVWEEQDNLDPENFEPHTFFQLHDGNNFLDPFEIEALFQSELDKVFNKTDPEYDPAERVEEANRMREHVFTEFDKDNDTMISLEEFIEATKRKDFKTNEEWKSVEDEQQFNQEEFEEFSRAHEEHDQTTPIPNVNHQQQQKQQQQQNPPPVQQNHHQ